MGSTEVVGASSLGMFRPSATMRVPWRLFLCEKETTMAFDGRRAGRARHARVTQIGAVVGALGALGALGGCDVTIDLGAKRHCANGSPACGVTDASGLDVGAELSLADDVPATNTDGGDAARTDASVMSEDIPLACPTATSTRCGSELIADWSVQPSCGAAFVGRSFVSTTVNGVRSSCTSAVDLSSPDSNAELLLRTVPSACRSPRPFTVTMVGRLPVSYQRGLGFVLNWPTGEYITLNRWVWNTAHESATDVLVSHSGGAFVKPGGRNADTGGTARPDRPWGWYIGNDGGWWRMAVTVDPAADVITVNFTQPSQSSMAYTATHSSRIPDDTWPTIKVFAAGPCDRSGLRSELLSVTTDPPMFL